MRGRPRRSLAFTVSTLLHATAILWGQWNFAPDVDVDLGDFDLQEVEVIDANALQGEEGLPDAPDAPKPDNVEALPTPEEIEKFRLEEERRLEEENRLKEEEERKKQEEADKKEEEGAEPKPYAPRGTKADDLSPPQSTFHALLVPKRIRKLPFAEKAADMLAPWPDFELLVSKGGLDPLRDFDHIVIASPEIRDWRQTFLAVDYKMSREQLKAAIERAVRRNGETIEWKVTGGIESGNPKPPEGKPDVDDRYFVLLPDKVAVYVHSAFLEHVLAGPKGEDKTSGNFVANLTRMKQYAARQPGSGFQLKVSEFAKAFKVRKARSDLPVDRVDEFELSVEAATEPHLTIRISMLDLVSAKLLEKFWKETLRELIDDKIALKIYAGALYESAEFERKGKEITIRGQFTETQITWFLDIVGDSVAKMMKKSPEELAKQRQERLENWEKRNQGKSGPAALDEPAE